MLNKRYVAALVALPGLLAACGLTSDPSEDGPGGPTTNHSAGRVGTAGSSGSGTGGSGAAGSGASGTGGSGAAGSGASGTGGVAGGEACVPGIPVTTQIPRLLNRQYEAVMRDLLGVTSLAGSSSARLSEELLADFVGPITEPAWRIYQDVADRIAQQVMAGPNKSKFISCDPAVAGCLQTTIESFGRKAYRRPLTPDEVARFLELGQTSPAPTPAELAETILDAFLVSPSFLMLPELSQAPNGSSPSIQLSSYELATRLSMLLWGSIPDDTLNAAADANQLQTKEQILAQAQRMIAVREKTAPMLTLFHRSWAQVDNASGHWWLGSHDPVKFPNYSNAAGTALAAEFDAFFEEIAFGKGTFRDFFLSAVAFVNRDTAAIYGLDPASFGSELKRVELDEQQRSGFLTRAGFLSSYSNYETSSPFLRGTFVAMNLLGIQLPPPIVMDGRPPVTGEYKTNRAYLSALTTPPACMACHSVINPLGFVFENYDAIGQWQTVDARGGAIDATATVQLSPQISKPISSPLQLMQEIANLPEPRRIYAQSWVSFAYGRPANANDECIVAELSRKLALDHYTILDLVSDLTQVESFRVRARGTP